MLDSHHTYLLVEKEPCDCPSSIPLVTGSAQSQLVAHQPATTRSPETSHTFPWKFVGCSAIALLCVGAGWNLAKNHETSTNAHLTRENLILRSRLESQSAQIADLSRSLADSNVRQKAIFECLESAKNASQATNNSINKQPASFNKKTLR